MKCQILDIENTMIAQVLDASRKSRKNFITNKVALVFLISYAHQLLALSNAFHYRDLGISKINI